MSLVFSSSNGQPETGVQSRVAQWYLHGFTFLVTCIFIYLVRFILVCSQLIGHFGLLKTYIYKYISFQYDVVPISKELDITINYDWN